MAEKATIKKITFEELASRVEKNQGVPKANFVESFKGAAKELKDIFANERPEKDGDALVVKTPIAALVAKRVGEHISKDEKGVEWKYTESIGVTAVPTREFVTIANTGFECKRIKVSK